LRAQERAEEAYVAYREAGTGSSHPQIRKTVADARTAGEKAGEIARLLAEAANAYADHVNIIAPGTVPARSSASGAMSSGEEILSQAGEQGAKKFGRATRKLTDGAGELGDMAKDLVQFVERIPVGSTGTVKPVTEVIPDEQAVSPNDLTGHLVVIGAIAARSRPEDRRFHGEERPIR
jgi:hypothetical protein